MLKLLLSCISSKTFSPIEKKIVKSNVYKRVSFYNSAGHEPHSFLNKNFIWSVSEATNRDKKSMTL